MFKLEFKFNSIIDFYANAKILEEKNGNPKMFAEFLKRDDKYFTGLSLKDIEKHKYHYRPGLAKLKELQAELPQLGGKRKIIKWSSEDGRELILDRLYEDLPFLKTIKKITGKKRGKFITVYVNISEYGGTSHESMMWKTIAAAKIVDSLEKQGYRVQVVCISNSSDTGMYQGSNVDLFYVEVVIKRFADPLNLPLLLTCISPWFFRYWTFLFRTGHNYSHRGVGCSKRLGKKSSIENIYIDHGECLYEEAYKEKLEELTKLGLEL